MSRRGTGEGTIRQRADGRWECRLFVEHADGRRVRRSVYGTSRQHVLEQLTAATTERKEKMKAGLLKSKSAATVAADQPRGGLSPDTWGARHVHY